ncbi:MAG: hypothetical protein ACRD12_10605 [Acidimicrobiales bacterium]
MTWAVLDDHLLRDLLADDLSEGLRDLLGGSAPATTNLYLYRLSKSVVSARGGSLTGGWTVEQRRSLGAQLVRLGDEVEIVPVWHLAFRMAEIADAYRLSTLGAEAVAAAERLHAPLCVWEGDDGPRIREAIGALGGEYRTIAR